MLVKLTLPKTFFQLHLYTSYTKFPFRKYSKNNKILYHNFYQYSIDIVRYQVNLVNDVKRKDHQRYNYLDEANAASTEAERSRAIDFLNACDYAIANFVKLDNVTAKDIAFFTFVLTYRYFPYVPLIIYIKSFIYITSYSFTHKHIQ